MKIEFLADGSQDCPLILIHGQGIIVVRRLAEVLHRLADGAVCRADLHGTAGLVAPGGIRLTASVSRWDVGVVEVSPASFEWQLTEGSWDNVAGLLEPFCRGPVEEHRHQYIEQAGDIAVIVSTDRSW